MSAERGSFRAGMAFGGASFLATTAIAIVSTVAVARLFGVEVVGELALASAPVNAAWYLANTRHGPALVRVLASRAPREGFVTGVFAVTLALSTALSAVVVAVVGGAAFLVLDGPLERPDLFAPCLALLVSFWLVAFPAQNFESVFSAFRDGRALFSIRVHQGIAFIALAAAARAVDDSVWAIVVATQLSLLYTLVHRLVLVRRWMRLRPQRAALREGAGVAPGIFRFGLKVAPGSLAEGVGNEAGTWIVGAAASIAAVGAYNRAWLTAQRFMGLGYRLNEMLLPTLVEHHERGDGAGFDRTLVDSLRYAAWALLLVAAAGGGAAEAVLWLFGPGFERAADALALLLLIPALSTLVAMQATAQYALDRPGASTIYAIVGAVARVGAAAALIGPLGLGGLALGLVAGQLLQFLLQSVTTHRSMRTPLAAHMPARQFAGLLLAFAGGFAAARLADAAIAEPAGLLVAPAAGAAIYAAVLFFVGGLQERDRARLGSVWRRLPLTGRGGPAVS